MKVPDSISHDPVEIAARMAAQAEIDAERAEMKAARAGNAAGWKRAAAAWRAAQMAAHVAWEAERGRVR